MKKIMMAAVALICMTMTFYDEGGRVIASPYAVEGSTPSAATISKTTKN